VANDSEPADAGPRAAADPLTRPPPTAASPILPRARDGLLGSVRTAARVLRAFSGGDGVMGVSEVARKLDISTSTAHRILATLAAERLLEHDASTGRYRPGLALYELGANVTEHVDLHAACQPVLTTLRHRTGEMVHVAVLDNLEVVYVERLESHQMLPVFRRVGHRLPAHLTSSGKVLLAALAPAELDRRLGSSPLVAWTRRSITDPGRLRAELAAVRSRGWASNVEEGQPGITSVGAAVHGADGAAMAALSVVAASQRMRGTTMQQTVGQLLEAAAVISTRLGYRPAR
jgi:IclR family transcriptional regulator, KDG regulon repressor